MISPFGQWESQRLRLRLFREEDAPVLFQEATSDLETMRYIQWPVQGSLREAQELAASFCGEIARGEKYYLVAERKPDGAVVAFASVRLDPPSAAVGFITARGYRKIGYARELLALLVSRLLEQQEIERVEAWCDVQNLASARTLERGGFVRVERLDGFGIHPNLGAAPRDVYRYVHWRR